MLDATAKIIINSRDDNTLIPDLDNNIPKDVEEAYLIQDQVVKSFNYNQIGWKVGCTTEMAQKFSGMTEPFSGIMFQETTFLSPNLDIKSYMNKPIIAAVNGICCGGGLELALSADIIFAAEHASFALPEIRSGTVADAASLKLPKRIPYHIAMEMLFTGRWLDSEEAARWGMINRVLKSKDLLASARELAELLASGPPLVYAAIKEVVREAEDMKFNDALNMITKSQFRTVETLYRSEDQLEGARAFSEKRDPVWKGK